jgi:putative membrane protein
VLSSILFIGKQIKSWNLPVILLLSLAAVGSYFITIAEPFASPDSNLYLLFCGAIAIIAMILPGISGAFILLILGAYQTAINTVDDLLQSVLTLNFELFKAAFIKFLMLSVGAVIGIKAFSKILNWMFKNHKNLTLAILTGFMIGSLNKIWPWKKVLEFRTNSHGEKVPFIEQSISPFNFEGNHQLGLSIVLIILGFLTIFILEKIGSKKG